MFSRQMAEEYLVSLGLSGDYGYYKSDYFRLRVLEDRIQIAVKPNFDRWSNSVKYELFFVSWKVNLINVLNWMLFTGRTDAVDMTFVTEENLSHFIRKYKRSSELYIVPKTEREFREFCKKARLSFLKQCSKQEYVNKR